jgi:SpoVK/Ycf46/Vps4 family AAA+-type ATPase
VLFFDEIDSIIGGEDESGGGKGHGMGRGTSAEARVLSTFLNEMDGVDGSVEDGVLVLGATNRPGTLDAALLRPGRFDRVIYVPPPDECGRRDILRMECTKWQRAILSCDSSRENDEASDDDTARQFFNIDTLASEDISGSMTGAELVGACRETAVGVMRTIMLSTPADESGKLSTTTKERLMQALKVGLISTLRNTRPLLSNANVLEEYTRFEEEHR